MFKADIVCSFWFCCYCVFPVCDKGYSSSPFVSPIFCWYLIWVIVKFWWKCPGVVFLSVFSQVSVIIVISELVLCISLLIKFSLCFSDLAFTVDTLTIQTNSWLLLSIVGTCLRFLISAFLFGLVCWFLSILMVDGFLLSRSSLFLWTDPNGRFVRLVGLTWSCIPHSC